MDPQNLPYAYTADLSQLIPDIPADSIVSRTVYNDARVKITLFGFAPGQELSEHTSSMPAIIHIVQGQGRLTLGQDEYEIQPGAWVHMPPNLTHSLQAQTPVLMLLTMFKARE